MTGVAARAAKRTNSGSSLLALGALAIGLVLSNPANAAGGLAGAEKLRKLDIMLMVTGLRCRATPDNFMAEYGNFTRNHMADLNQASNQLKAQMATRHGAAGANRALDRLSTTMANQYGQGHPWLNCRELKTVAYNLAQVRGRATLEEAADQLLAGDQTAYLASARRR
jgi:hypothetical protein